MAKNMNKDLLKAMQGVNKKFGNSMSNFASEIEEKPIVSYSTGSRLLDFAIGEGNRAGLPEGRLIELFGPESSGKCVTADTYILTPQGYKTLETLFKENGTPIETKEEEVPAEISLINRYGEEENTYAVTFNGEKDLLEITTKHGFRVKVTKNHPLLIKGDWVEAKDITLGQHLSLLSGTNIFNQPGRDGDEIVVTSAFNESFFGNSKSETMSMLQAVEDYALDENGVIEIDEEEARVLQLVLLNLGIIASREDNGLYLEKAEVAKLKAVLDGEEHAQAVFHDEVVNIEELAPAPTFDVAMKDTQSFIGNGIVNHNTTISLLAIAERQRIENEKAEADPSYEKKFCVFMDAEFALDTDLAIEYGVDMDELIIIRPDQAEDGMDVLDSYVRTGSIGLAVVDSVSAMVPAQVEQSSFQQQTMAVLARFMSQVATRMSGPAWKNGTTILFINQVREKVGAWSPTGVAETTPGGRGLKFHATLRIRVRRGETIGPSEAPEGHVMNVQIVKNKIGMPNRKAAVKLLYGVGVDTIEELGELAIALGVAHQGGAWFKVIDRETGEVLQFKGEEANFQGRNNLFNAIEENDELRAYIEQAVKGIEDDEEEDVENP